MQNDEDIILTEEKSTELDRKRSKREDEYGHEVYEFEGVEYCDTCLMRCSEHCGNTVREVQ